MEYILVLLHIVLSGHAIAGLEREPERPNEPAVLYFAYGSNLLPRRMYINNPSATLVGIARLKDYRLDFAVEFKPWQGAVATIVPEPGEHVWGALWRIPDVDLPNLDRQEQVDAGLYKVKNVSVELPYGAMEEARTYIEVVLPVKIYDERFRPFERKPSKTYLQVIILGAVQVGLPFVYIEKLYKFDDNGLLAVQRLRDQLGPPFNATEANPH